jgi:transposase-like protein
MRSKTKRNLATGAFVLAVAAFGGGAYAASQSSGPSSRQAFVSDVAKRLNVTPQQLRSALQGAFFDQLDAAVKAGRLTQAQANAIKQRVQQNGLPPLLLGPAGLGDRGFFGGHGSFGAPRPGLAGGAISAAATYLGLSRTQLLDQLRSGKSLAQVAKSRGKSVNGLEQAMSSAIRSRLDKAVAAGRITKAQEQQILSRLSSRLANLINRMPPRFGGPGLPGHRGPIPGGAPPPPNGAGPPATFPGPQGGLPPGPPD